MDFLEMAKPRYSARSYSEKQLTKEILDKILEAGRIAPTAVNFQPQKIIVVQSKEGLEKIEAARTIYNAPTALIVCNDKDISWKRRRFDNKEFGDIDVTIVTTYMMLEASSLGVDSLWVGAFDPEMIRRDFNLPQNLEPINILALGYADCEPTPSDRYDTQRKPIEETVFYERV